MDGEDSHGIRLRGGTVLTATDRVPAADTEVEIGVDGRISYVGPCRPDNASAARIIDTTGNSVLPGFVDCHVHFMLWPSNPFMDSVLGFDSYRLMRTMRNLEVTLQAGVTFARDLGGTDRGVVQAIDDGTIVGPRLHLACGVMSPTGGHVDLTLPNGYTFNHPRECTHRHGPIFEICDSDDEVRQGARRLLRAGVDVIKICSSGGIASPTDEPEDLGVPEHQIRIIVEEATNRGGRPVASHAIGKAGVIAAARGGVTSVEHGYGIDDEGIEAMLAHGTWLVPTLSAISTPPTADAPVWQREKKKLWKDRAFENCAKAIAAGVPVALGTDAGISSHGRNLEELARLVEVGMKPYDAIKAGTVQGARLMGVADQVGTLEVGKLGDVVVVEGDPLDDIRVMADPARIRLVAKAGRTVARSIAHGPY